MEAVEKIVQFDANGIVHISLGKNFSQKKAKVIILISDDLSEEEWMNSAGQNPAFDFLKDEPDDLYSIEDGKPYSG